MFLLTEFCCETPPSCIKVGGWVGGLQHFSVSPRPLGFLVFGFWGFGFGARAWQLALWIHTCIYVNLTLSNNSFFLQNSDESTGKSRTASPLVHNNWPPDDVVWPRQFDQLVHHVNLHLALAIRHQITQVSNFTHWHIIRHRGIEVSQHGGAAICEVAPGVDVEAVDAGTEAGDGAGHLDIVTVHLGEHNPPLNGVSLHDRNSRLGQGYSRWCEENPSSCGRVKWMNTVYKQYL